MKNYYVYILSNYNQTVFYTGVTSNLEKRIFEHTNKLIDGFMTNYNIVELLYYEIHGNIEEAIKREKSIKKWKRDWKWNLIKEVNPCVENLYKKGNIIALPINVIPHLLRYLIILKPYF